MTGLAWIGSLVIGGCIGWIIGTVGTNKLRNIILGIFGAIVLNALVFAAVGSVVGGWIGYLIFAALGACLMIAAAHFLRRWI